MAYLLITAGELDAFTVAVQRQGFDVHDFEFQEEVLDPQMAEVEARKGDVGIRCLRTNAVAAYPLGVGRTGSRILPQTWAAAGSDISANPL
jgi:hypothetical protein